MRATQLVAVDQRGDHRVRSGPAAVERGDVGHAGVAAPIRADVGRGDLDLGLGHQAATARSTSPRRKPAQRSSSARSTHSSGLMRERHVAGSADHARDPARREQAGLGAERHFARARAAGELAAQPLDRGIAGAAERRIAHQLLPRDRGARVPGAHRGQQLGLSEGLHLAQQLRCVLPRQRAELELEAALVRHDVERGPGRDDAGRDRAMRRIEALLKRPAGAELEVPPAQVDDDLGRDLERVDAPMTERGVAGKAASRCRHSRPCPCGRWRPACRWARRSRSRTASPAAAPRGGRADAARPCTRPPRRSSARDGSAPRSRRARNSGTSASTVATKPFMSAAPRPCRRPSRSTQTNGSLDQSWPSTGTTSVWPDSTRPGAIRRPDRGDQIGLAAAVVEHQLGRDAQTVEVVADEIDQREVGVAAGGVEPDQPRQHLGRGQRACSGHAILAGDRSKVRWTIGAAGRAVMSPGTVSAPRRTGARPQKAAGPDLDAHHIVAGRRTVGAADGCHTRNLQR